MLAWGATRVVIGTKAATEPALVERLLARHGPDRLAVGIDARDGRVAVRGWTEVFDLTALELARREIEHLDRKSTRLNSSHGYISYAVFCLKKKKNNNASTRK